MEKVKNVVNEEMGFQVHDKIYLENIKERKIILNDGVDACLYELVAMQIQKFNDEDEVNGIAVEDRKPIRIFVNSYGGVVYDGFGIGSAIQRSKTPVHTICDGYVMSMGFFIFAAGHKRFAGRFSNFMYHEVSTISIGKNTEIEEVTKENRRIQKMYDEFILEQTDIKKTTLDKVKKAKKDWFFGVDEAVKLGLVHEVL
ncbi:ATP-dependent Clp protease proteolytic subunit [Priestia megaterium]